MADADGAGAATATEDRRDAPAKAERESETMDLESMLSGSKRYCGSKVNSEGDLLGNVVARDDREGEDNRWTCGLLCLPSRELT